jgi:hypothetical protein
MNLACYSGLTRLAKLGKIDPNLYLEPVQSHFDIDTLIKKMKDDAEEYAKKNP